MPPKAEADTTQPGNKCTRKQRPRRYLHQTRTACIPATASPAPTPSARLSDRGIQLSRCQRPGDVLPPSTRLVRRAGSPTSTFRSTSTTAWWRHHKSLFPEAITRGSSLYLAKGRNTSVRSFAADNVKFADGTTTRC